MQPIQSFISNTVAPAMGALALIEHGVHNDIATVSPCLTPSDDLPIGLGCGSQLIALEIDNKSVLRKLVRIKRSQTADALPQRTDLDLEGNDLILENRDDLPFEYAGALRETSESETVAIANKKITTHVLIGQFLFKGLSERIFGGAF